MTRVQQPSMTELPILLWNQGLIDLEKLGQIFDWMESVSEQQSDSDSFEVKVLTH